MTTDAEERQGGRGRRPRPEDRAEKFLGSLPLCRDVGYDVLSLMRPHRVQGQTLSMTLLKLTYIFISKKRFCVGDEIHVHTHTRFVLSSVPAFCDGKPAISFFPRPICAFQASRLPSPLPRGNHVFRPPTRGMACMCSARKGERDDEFGSLRFHHCITQGTNERHNTG